MKMPYRLIRNRSGNRIARRSILASLAVLALLASFHFFYPRALGDAISRAAEPLWKGERALRDTLSRLGWYLAGETRLVREVEELRASLAHAQADAFLGRALAEENRELKEALGRRADEPPLLAAVLAVPPRSLYDTLVLDVGSADGVVEGDEVQSAGRVLGRVARVFSHTSIVELFSTAGRETDTVILHGDRRFPITAIGAGGGVFTVTVPKELAVALGDAVVLPGLSERVFARVEAALSGASDSFQLFYLKAPVSWFELRFVEVSRERGTDAE